MRTHHLFAWAVATLAASPAAAEFCDLRLSQQLGGAATTALAAGSAATGATGATLQAMGYYTITNATTGATMLASTVAGGSAAGTVGIIGGTSTGVGAAAGGAMAAAPAAAALAIVIVGVEGGCYLLHDEVVTDPQEVFNVLHMIAAQADPEVFRLDYPNREGSIAPSEVQLLVRNEEGHLEIYDLEDIYLWNGVLKYDGWVTNGVLPLP